MFLLPLRAASVLLTPNTCSLRALMHTRAVSAVASRLTSKPTQSTFPSHLTSLGHSLALLTLWLLARLPSTHLIGSDRQHSKKFASCHRNAQPFFARESPLLSSTYLLLEDRSALAVSTVPVLHWESMLARCVKGWPRHTDCRREELPLARLRRWSGCWPRLEKGVARDRGRSYMGASKTQVRCLAWADQIVDASARTPSALSSREFSITLAPSLALTSHESVFPKRIHPKLGGATWY
ncbi:hypothetical protein IE81DRAFT_323365 [Ceraceosorus guamensis]|uniref:Uncharacterized protein n=1 Tax=Ceraceosorus guamensis TaxID=1522189 RepID=A0A316W4R4_9BASI|nr:hypothetical protein IE81DRAFT_323365 [Ceraceosorus guamensis]PWN42605.1 hypothetical protein IE81DRAFT_323365 [Ceraceosorus guamensis]